MTRDVCIRRRRLRKVCGVLLGTVGHRVDCAGAGLTGYGRMAHIGVFYSEGFDPGAYTVALYHAQLEAARGGHGLSIHQFPEGSLAVAAERAPEVDGLLAFATGEADLEFLRGHSRPSVVCERVAPGCANVAPDNHDMWRERRPGTSWTLGTSAWRWCCRAIQQVWTAITAPASPGFGDAAGGRPVIRWTTRTSILARRSRRPARTRRKPCWRVATCRTPSTCRTCP